MADDQQSPEQAPEQKIVRTPTQALGGITPEEKVKLEAHAKLWIANALSTEPIVPEKIIPAIKDLYKSVELKEPRVVLTKSPRSMAFIGGMASAISWSFKNQSEAKSAGIITGENKLAALLG